MWPFTKKEKIKYDHYGYFLDEENILNAQVFTTMAGEEYNFLFLGEKNYNLSIPHKQIEAKIYRGEYLTNIYTVATLHPKKPSMYDINYTYEMAEKIHIEKLEKLKNKDSNSESFLAYRGRLISLLPYVYYDGRKNIPLIFEEKWKMTLVTTCAWIEIPVPHITIT
jgi:hypothetical protein